MAPTEEGKKSGSLVRFLAILVPLALVLFLGMRQANFVAGRALLVAFGDLETTYKSAWPTIGGNVTARDVYVKFPDLPPDSALRFETLRVETPGLFWFIRSMFQEELPVADRLRLELGDAASPGSLDYTLGSLEVFGIASASPFEAEGCATDRAWDMDDLREMDLDPGPTRVAFEWKIEGRLLTVTKEVNTPNVSTARYRRLEQMPQGRTNIIVIDYIGDSQVMSDRWEVEDAGFVAARNQYCARRDGVDEAMFRERHIAAVVRLMEAEGLGVGDDAIARYRAFIEKGGSIAMGGQYQFSMAYNGNYSDERWIDSLPSLSAFVYYDNAQSAVAWRLVDTRPLITDEEATTFELMRREGSLPPELLVIQPTEPTPEDLAAETPVPTTPEPPVGAASAATAAPEPTPPPITAAAAPAPTPPAPPAPDPAPPVGPALAATTPTPTTAPPTQPTPHPRRPKRGDEVPFANLPNHIGWFLQFNTTKGKHRRAEVVRADADSVHIRVRYNGGWATYSIARNELISVTVY